MRSHYFYQVFLQFQCWKYDIDIKAICSKTLLLIHTWSGALVQRHTLLTLNTAISFYTQTLRVGAWHILFCPSTSFVSLLLVTQLHADSQAFSGLAKWALTFRPMASLVLWILHEAKMVCYFCSCSDMWLEVSYVQQNEKSFSAQSSLRLEPSIRK